MKEWEVDIDYPSESMIVKAETKEEAEIKALDLLGDVTIRVYKECTAEATEL